MPPLGLFLFSPFLPSSLFVHELTSIKSEVLFGEGAISTYLARKFGVTELLGASLFEEVEVQQWLSYTARLNSLSTEDFLNTAKELNSHLSLRTFFVGYSLTLADVSVWAGLHANFAGNAALRDSNNFPHLKRFLGFLGGLTPRFGERIPFLYLFPISLYFPTPSLS